MNRLRVHVAGFALGSLSLVLAGCGGAAVPDTPDATVNHMAQGLAADDPSVVWDMLPPSYQKDVNGLVGEFATKVDAGLYDAGMSAAAKVVSVLEQKKEFVLASPMVSGLLQMAPGGPDAVTKSYGDVVGLVGTLVKSEVSTHAKLSTLDVGDMLEGTGKKLMSMAHAVAKGTEGAEWPDFSKMKAELVETEGDTAKVKLTNPDGRTNEEEMKKVEGRWLPAPMVDDWADMMKSARAQLAGMAPSEADTKGALAMVKQMDGVLDEILAADTQMKFNVALGKVMQGPLGKMMQGPGGR